MDTEQKPLPAGYHDVAPNMLATIVTCLEMTTRQHLAPIRRPMG